MKPLQALCFDLDETLLDGSRLAEANGEIWPGYWREVEEKWTLGALSGAAVSLEAWRLTLRACGCNDESTARLALRIHSQIGREAHRLFDDVRELLTSVRKARVALALITNGASDTQRDKLRVLEMEDWFDAIVISGEVGIAKPDAFAFDLAIDRLAVGRENVWHIGDSLATDVGGAKAAGLTAVWLNRRGLVRSEGDPEPDIEIHSLSNLTAFLPR